MDHRSIIKDIRNGKFEKIYFLHGEGPYYIDEITEAIMENAMEEHERDFNQIVVYGKDTDPLSLISELKGYPMMGARKLVVLKEAQDMKGIDDLAAYVEAPSDSTVFVLNYKYKNYDARKALLKASGKNGIVFKSEKVRDYLMVDWIQAFVKSLGYGITGKAAMLLSEFLGNDLSRIANEINKLTIILEKGTNINDVHIEENIGVSKDYNGFELVNALATRDFPKAMKIVDYFDHNPKAGEFVVLIALIFKFYSELMRIHFLPNKSKEAVAAALKINPFFAGERINASKVFDPKKIAANIAILHEYDLKFKGVGSTGAVTSGDLLKEMVYRLLH